MNVKPLERSATRAELEAAATTLCLGTDLSALTEEMVKDAYRERLFAEHPDHAPTLEAAERIKQIRDARVLLMVFVQERPRDDCTTCRGSGFVRVGVFGTKPCPRCRG